MSDDKSEKCLYITCLPGLDEIGHIHGPGSQAIKAHLYSIDSKLAYLIRKHGNDTSFIITGDHGCRKIGRYVIEIEHNTAAMAVYRKSDDKIEFVERYVMESRDKIFKIEYDGGNLRIWFEDGQGHLTSNDISFIQKYGEIQPVNDEEKKEFYLKSDHPNQGDVAIIAHHDTMFCKKDWIIDGCVIEKILQSADLKNGDLPRGEHGTYHDEDRIVAFMSDHNFGVKEIKNIMVPEFVKRLMK